MKKKIGIISIIIAFTMLLSAIAPLTVSAAELPPELSIKAKNLSFSESIYIIYYVEAKNVSVDDVQLLIWNEPQERYTAKRAVATLDPVRTETISGKEYIRFEYRGLAAKNMSDTVYAKAYTVSGDTEYFSELSDYSILQYAYNKLGKTGTATDDAELKNLLIKMLDYGASAQKYFKHNTGKLANSNLLQVTAVGGSLPDGTNRGFYVEGDFVELTANAPAEGMKFSGWKNSAGEMISTETSLTVMMGSSNEDFSAVFCPLDHSTATSSVIAPTSMSDGYTLYTCQNCGESYRADYVTTTGSKGLSYSKNSDGTTCTITGLGNCTDIYVKIPEYIDGYKVTAIGNKAFQSKTSIKSVYIPDAVTTIGQYAFQGCSSLEYVDFPKSLETIKGYAFQNCTLLSTPIVFYTNLKKIENYAFSSCSSIKNVYYEGTEDEWNAIDISYGYSNGTIMNGNNYLQNATMNYLYSNNESYVINKATSTITIDAVKDAAYSSTINCFNRCVGSADSGGNGKTIAYVAYTASGLYVYGEVEDSTILTTDTDHGDIFQVYVDFVNNHAELGLNGNDYRTANGTSKAKKLGWIFVKPDGTTGSSWGFSGVSITAKTKTIDKGYAVELFIPFPSTGLNPENIGLGFEIKDDVDGDGVRETACYDSGMGLTYYARYETLTDYVLSENYNPDTTQKVEYSKVSIGLDGYRDATYRTKVDISAPWSSNPSGSKGYGTAWIAQDGRGLYFYVDVVDDKIFNNDDNDAGEGDRVQIYLDYANNHDKLGLSGSNYRATYSTESGCLGYIAISPDGDIKSTYSFSTFGNIKAKTRLTDTGYAVEVYVPFANEAVMSDTIGIGFELQNDTDGVIGSNGKHSREAIFFDKSEGISYYLYYDWLADYKIEEKPLLTSFCMTDIHNNFAMLAPPYVIRGTATLAIEHMLATEGKVDVVVIGGDYMSDYPHWVDSGKLPYEYFLGYKAKTIETFNPLAEGGKVIYIAGNHDYAQGEAATDAPHTATGNYNSFDFYYGEGAMEDTMGVLEDGDAFWKIGENTGDKYLLAYYYEVNGIGFAGLSPDPDIVFNKQGDGMSDIVLAWLDQKLDFEDPDGTKIIFLNCHYPIDGRGLTGLSTSSYHKEKLTPIFLGHNNLFHLYGHWETYNAPYSSNEVFHYDMNGNLISGPENETNASNIIAPDKRGFNAVYMGHFRPMYNSYPDWFFNDPVYGYGGKDSQTAEPSTKTPKVAQGMYIEVFEDRVVFTMKNYGIIPNFETGTESVPYTVYLHQKVNNGAFESPDDIIW